MKMKKERFNTVKTVGPDSALRSGHTLMLGGAQLPWKDQVCSLRVLLDPTMHLGYKHVVAVVSCLSLALCGVHQQKPFLEKDFTTNTHPKLHSGSTGAGLGNSTEISTSIECDSTYAKREPADSNIQLP